MLRDFLQGHIEAHLQNKQQQKYKLHEYKYFLPKSTIYLVGYSAKHSNDDQRLSKAY